MTIQFPNNPILNQTVTTGGKEWIYNGHGWVTIRGNLVSQGSPGGSVSASNLSAVSSNVIPTVDSVYDLGSANYRWRDLFLSGNTLVIGTAQLSVGANGLSVGTYANANGELSLAVSSLQIGTGANAIIMASSANGLVVNSSVGPVNVADLVGATGATGIQGNIGATGIQGNIGATGATGIQGNIS